MLKNFEPGAKTVHSSEPFFQQGENKEKIFIKCHQSQNQPFQLIMKIVDIQVKTLTLPEEILLILLDEEKGTLRTVPPTLGLVLAGAVLMELAIQNRIDCQSDTIEIIDREPLNAPIIDKYMQRICDEPEHKKVKFWINAIADDSANIVEAGYQWMAERRFVDVREKRFLWIVISRSYSTREGTFEREMKDRVMDVLYSDEIPDQRDMAIVSLMDAGDLFRTLLGTHELNRLRSRISDISKLDLTGQTITKLIREIQVDRDLLTAAVVTG